MLSASLKRAFRWRFWIAVLLVAFAIAFDSWATLLWALSNTFNPDGILCVHYFLFNSVSFGGVFGQYFIAILAAIPFSTEYVEEHNMLPYILARTRPVRYGFSKMFSAALSGGLALALGGILFITALSLKLPLVSHSRLFEMQWIPYFSLLNYGDGIGYLIVFIALMFLKGFLCGGLCICISAYIPNKFVVTASPFVMSFVLVQICRLMRITDKFRLDYLLSGRSWLGSTSIRLIFLVSAVAITWGICCVIFTKRIRRGLS